MRGLSEEIMRVSRGLLGVRLRSQGYWWGLRWKGCWVGVGVVG